MSVWLTPAVVARLGTVPDAVVAAELGLTRSCVEKNRRRLGIRAWNETRPVVWYDQQLERDRQRRAAAAIAAGRTPGLAGRKPRLRWDRSVGPLYDTPAGDPLYDEARAYIGRRERHELGTVFDSGVRDLVQEYVLAVVEGRDPEAAVEAARKRVRLDRIVVRHDVAFQGIDLTMLGESNWGAL